MRNVILFARVLLRTLPTFAQIPVPDPASIGHTTGRFHMCPPIGDARLDGGSDDPYLNALRNRDKPPNDGAYITITIKDLIADKPAGAMAAGKKRRDQWTREQRESIEAQEKQAIEVVGYLALPPKKEDKESYNCHSTIRVGYRLWLVETEDLAPTKTMVVEISPRMLDKHPNWPKIMAKVAQNEYVILRVRGWRTWNQEHSEELGQTRGTLWEISPIISIDTQEEDYWFPIDELENDTTRPADLTSNLSPGRR